MVVDMSHYTRKSPVYKLWLIIRDVDSSLLLGILLDIVLGMPSLMQISRPTTQLQSRGLARHPKAMGARLETQTQSRIQVDIRMDIPDRQSHPQVPQLQKPKYPSRTRQSLQSHLDNPSFGYPSTPSLLRQQSPIYLMIVDILIRLAANLCAILLLCIQLFDWAREVVQ